MKSTENNKGFTLIEVVIAVALTLLLAVACYKLYYQFIRSTSCSDQRVEAQQKARMATEMMYRDISLTGYDVPSKFPITKELLPSVVVAKESEVTFRFVNPNHVDGEKKRFVLTYEAGTTEENPITKTECEADENWDITTVCKSDSYINNLDPNSPGGGLFFKYYNVGGAEVFPELEPTEEDKQKMLDSIRYIAVAVTVRTEKECLRVDGTTGYDSMSIDTRIRLRNKLSRGKL